MLPEMTGRVAGRKEGEGKQREKHKESRGSKEVHLSLTTVSSAGLS